MRTFRTLCELLFTLVSQWTLREVKHVRDVVLTRLKDYGLLTPRSADFAAAFALVEGSVCY